MEQSTLQKLAIPIAIVIAGVTIAGAVFFGVSRSSGGSAALGAQGPQARPQQPVDSGKVNVAGEPFIGRSDAPVTIAYWYDYQCPFCQRHEEQTMPQIVKDYVDTGKVKIVFKDFQFLGEDSQRLGKVSRAVWEFAPGKFYAWHKAVYDNQGEENTGWATDAKILSITANVFGAADAQTIIRLAAKNAGAYQSAMDADRAEGSAMGVNGTPGAIIGTQSVSGAQPYAAFKQAIDAALRQK